MQHARRQASKHGWVCRTTTSFRARIRRKAGINCDKVPALDLRGRRQLDLACAIARPVSRGIERRERDRSCTTRKTGRMMIAYNFLRGTEALCSSSSCSVWGILGPALSCHWPDIPRLSSARLTSAPSPHRLPGQGLTAPRFRDRPGEWPCATVSDRASSFRLVLHSLQRCCEQRFSRTFLTASGQLSDCKWLPARRGKLVFLRRQWRAWTADHPGQDAGGRACPGSPRSLSCGTDEGAPGKDRLFEATKADNSSKSPSIPCVDRSSKQRIHRSVFLWPEHTTLLPQTRGQAHLSERPVKCCTWSGHQGNVWILA